MGLLMPSDDPATFEGHPMEKLSLILWRERELLDTLLYKLDLEQLVLGSGRSKWLMRAAKEVESVLELIRETEILRATAADEAAQAIGLTHNPSLRALAEAVEDPWRTIMLDHRDAFAALTREVSELAEASRDLITVGYRSAQSTLLALSESADGYTPDGSAVTGLVRHQLVDRSL